MASGSDFKTIDELQLALNLTTEPLEIEYSVVYENKYNKLRKSIIRYIKIYKWQTKPCKQLDKFIPKNPTEAINYLLKELSVANDLLNSKK